MQVLSETYMIIRQEEIVIKNEEKKWQRSES